MSEELRKVREVLAANGYTVVEPAETIGAIIALMQHRTDQLRDALRAVSRGRQYRAVHRQCYPQHTIDSGETSGGNVSQAHLNEMRNLFFAELDNV